ncbi:hypothetical protein D5086_011718 [Populus alba]|uniref:Uncharacterized protein n=1 Tax=Populus alba TaxID=43335 RepID=A0ACC4CD09_POPAL
MRKKRKGSEADAGENVQEEVIPTCDLKSSNVRSHYSLEDYNRLKKRCKEDLGREPVTSFKSRLAGIATAPPCGASSSLVLPGRGLKRKIGCIDVATQTGQTLSGLAGSPAYVAPEVLSGNYSEKVDIWSAGVLLHALLVGGLPFQGDSLEAVFEAIKNVKLDFHTGIWDSVSKPARDLVARMLTRDVSARITADEVLRHPWILFYTERTLKTLSIRSKTKNQGAATSCQPANALALVSPGNRVGVGSSEEDLSQNPSDSLSCKSEEQDECGLVDALAVAISHVKISEPKRSRLCGPTGPIEQQCSSNITANNLCRAF